jgi:hypothetical protein
LVSRPVARYHREADEEADEAPAEVIERVEHFAGAAGVIDRRQRDSNHE